MLPHSKECVTFRAARQADADAFLVAVHRTALNFSMIKQTLQSASRSYELLSARIPNEEENRKSLRWKLMSLSLEIVIGTQKACYPSMQRAIRHHRNNIRQPVGQPASHRTKADAW